jgi:hypothetical protein
VEVICSRTEGSQKNYVVDNCSLRHDLEPLFVDAGVLMNEEKGEANNVRILAS